MKDRVNKFTKFIQENEVKRRRAVQKYHFEINARQIKNRECKELSLRLKSLLERYGNY